MTEPSTDLQSDQQQPKGDWLTDGQKRPPVYLVRHKDGLNVHSGASDAPHLSVEDEVFHSVWAPDGSQLVINGSSSGLVVYRHPLWIADGSSSSAENHTRLNLVKFPNSPSFPARSLRHLQWAPKGGFVVAHWQYDAKAASAGQDERNVLVWKTSMNCATPSSGATATDLQPIAAFSLKGIAMGQWPILKWRNDERFCLLSSRSEVMVFEGNDLGGAPMMRIPLSGVISTEPAPVLTTAQQAQSGIGPDGLIFAAFSPTSTATETDSIFRIVVVPEVRRKGGGDDWHLSVQKPLGSSDSADVSWSPSGATVLVLASTTVDAAGENYGGVGDVYLARFDGSLTVKVNKAVAQEACWNPCRDEFIVIEGKSPSEMYLYDKDCNIQYEFPVAYRNTVRWDCFGLMVALGGFGNLAGDLSFWFRDTEARCMRVIADWREPCTVLCGWSPDGRHFYTASTHPRMKVDNQFKVFNYEGNLLTMKTYPQLYDFQWKPEVPGKYSAPPHPTPQISAIAAAKKFKSSRDLANDSKVETKRFATARNRKEVQANSTPSTASTTATGATASSTAKAAAPTVPTAAQAAKLERNRHLDSISDWRAAPKEPKESDSGTNEAPPQQQKRRGSTAKAKLEEKSAATSDATASNSGGDDAKSQASQPRAPVDNPKSLSTASRSAAARSQAATSDKLTPSGASSKTRSGAITPADQHPHRAQPMPTLPATDEALQSESRPLSPLAKDFMPSTTGNQRVLSGATQPRSNAAPSAPLQSEQQRPPFTSSHPTPQSVSVSQIMSPHPMSAQPLSPQSVSPQTESHSASPQAPMPHIRQPQQYPPPQRPPLVPIQSPNSDQATPKPSTASDGNNTSNSSGLLLNLLKSILPPDASVHVSRDPQNNRQPNPIPTANNNDYETDFPSLDDRRQSALNSNRTVSSLADRPFSPIGALQQQAPPTSSADRVESLVNLLVRAQKERTPRPPLPAAYGGMWQQQQQQADQQRSESYLDERSMVMNHPNNNMMNHNKGMPNSFNHIQQQQQQQPYVQQHLHLGHHQNVVSSIQQQPQQQHQNPNAVGASPGSSTSFVPRPDSQLLQELQNRFRQSRGDPRQQAAVLQALLQLQQQSAGAQQRNSPQQQQQNLVNANVPLSQMNMQQQPSPQPTPQQQRPTQKLWEYLDPAGRVQGPFDLMDMRKWHSLGYFEPTLPVRCGSNGNFTPLSRLFPPGTEPFKLS